MTRHKLGVFDSGLGGLTVANEIKRAFPSVDIVYLGDTARVPYGIRSEETLRRYLSEGCHFLRERNVDAIILACNTLSSLLPVPSPIALFGVIESGAIAAYKASKNKKIGLIGTEATIHSKAYTRALQLLDSTVEVFAAPAPLLVPLIEEGWLDGDVTRQIVRHYILPLVENGIDTLILGCTHYPLLKKVIEAELNDPRITVVDNGSALSEELSQLLPELTREDPHLGSLSVFVTDAPRRFDEIARRFLGGTLETVEKISLPTMV
jgi:glutamate racemase